MKVRNESSKASPENRRGAFDFLVIFVDLRMFWEDSHGILGPHPQGEPKKRCWEGWGFNGGPTRTYCALGSLPFQFQGCSTQWPTSWYSWMFTLPIHRSWWISKPQCWVGRSCPLKVGNPCVCSICCLRLICIDFRDPAFLQLSCLFLQLKLGEHRKLKAPSWPKELDMESHKGHKPATTGALFRDRLYVAFFCFPACRWNVTCFFWKPVFGWPGWPCSRATPKDCSWFQGSEEHLTHGEIHRLSVLSQFTDGNRQYVDFSPQFGDVFFSSAGRPNLPYLFCMSTMHIMHFWKPGVVHCDCGTPRSHLLPQPLRGRGVRRVWRNDIAISQTSNCQMIGLKWRICKRRKHKLGYPTT